MPCWLLPLSADWIISAVGLEGINGAHAGSFQQLLSPNMQLHPAEELHLLTSLLWEAAGLVGDGYSAISS